MKYMFIKEHSSVFLVRKTAQLLKVTRSGYYEWKKRPMSKRKQEEYKLLMEIYMIHEKKRKLYGSRRIMEELKKAGKQCSKNRIARIMKTYDIRPKTKKKFKVTTHSKHEKPVTGDLVKRNFTASAKNELWTSDITYIWTREGWLYLAVILDIFCRKIVGWALDSSLSAKLVSKALIKAICGRKPKPGIIFHSDKGIQFASKEVKRILKFHGIQQSMSWKGDCFDNAITESFFHTFKTEFVYFEDFQTKKSCQIKTFDYIEVFYNRERLHSSLGISLRKNLSSLKLLNRVSNFSGTDQKLDNVICQNYLYNSPKIEILIINLRE